jgi:glycosyltransferase involved in cell wall biosynthesis
MHRTSGKGTPHPFPDDGIVSTYVSVVVPVFRSGGVLPLLYSKIAAVLDGLQLEWELVLVDDASNDGTFDVMRTLNRQDPRVRVVRFARNMGQHHATLYGIQKTTGEFVVTLDDDLQNPPEEIPRFLAAMTDADLVIGKISGAKEHSISRNLASRSVQSLVGSILGKPKSLSLSSYRCMTRRAATAIGQYSGAHVYMPALMLGAVPVDRIRNIDVAHHPRASGTSQYTLRKLARLLSYLLINHSALPLRFMTGWGILLSIASLCYAAFVLLDVLINGSSVTGWPTLAIMVSFMSGNILMSMGILGEYVGRLIAENARSGQSPVFEEYG